MNGFTFDLLFKIFVAQTGFFQNIDSLVVRGMVRIATELPEAFENVLIANKEGKNLDAWICFARGCRRLPSDVVENLRNDEL